MRKFVRKMVGLALGLLMGATILAGCTGNGDGGNQGSAVPSIGYNGNWWIDGVDTGIKAVGEDGEQGVPGQDGTSLLTGNGAPHPALGKDGDSYIDLDSWDFYTKAGGQWVSSGNIKGEQGAPGQDGAEGSSGSDGAQGIPGQDGTSLLTGHGAPDADLGKDGDSYIDLDTWNFYGKEDGKWISRGNIQGSQGLPGVDGHTPVITISEDGYWVIDGVKTDVKATPEDPIVPKGLSFTYDSYFTQPGKALPLDLVNNTGDPDITLEISGDSSSFMILSLDSDSFLVLMPSEGFGQLMRYDMLAWAGDSFASAKLFLGDEPLEPTAPIHSLKSILLAGESTTVELSAHEGNVTYYSSDESVAIVSPSGMVTAQDVDSSGHATIYAVHDDLTFDSRMVSVLPEQYDPGSGSDLPGATGVVSVAPWEEGMDHGEYVESRSEALATLEEYALDSHLAGIPVVDLYDYVAYSPRITLPTETYLTDYGYGVEEGALDPSGNMMDGQPAASGLGYPDYYHGYALYDSGTFNAWNSYDEGAIERHERISSSYYRQTPNEAGDGLLWVPELAKDERPVMLDENGNEVAYEEGERSRFWRVHLHTGDDDADGVQYRYALSENSPYYEEFNGRPIRLEDYLTPYKAMLDNNLARANGLAQDSTGFAGVYTYLYGNRDWSQVGIQVNEEEGSLDFEFVTPQSQFDAMYNLSSSIYSPVPAEFLYRIGGGRENVDDGSSLGDEDSLPSGWGNFISQGVFLFGGTLIGVETETISNIISVGPYVVESWELNEECVYSKNDTYFRASDYHYEGYVETIFQDNEEGAWHAFLSGELDEIDVPIGHREEAASLLGDALRIGGERESVRLNLNSCTQEEWNYYFGPNGSVTQNRTWQVKPLMSNENFLNGLYYSIDRTQMAGALGGKPALGYLGDNFLIDPENGVSYRDTAAAKAVLHPYSEASSDSSDGDGYNKELAVSLFAQAIGEEVAAGNYENGDTIRLTAKWRYQRTISDIGSYLKNYIESAWDLACELSGYNVDLVIDNVVAGSSYNDCYTAMSNGEYDFAEGSIVPDFNRPFEYMANVSSTPAISRGFTTSFGERTDLVSAHHPIEWDHDGDDVADFSYSYDTFLEACRGSTITVNGANGLVVPEDLAYASSGDGNTVFYIPLPMFSHIPDIVSAEYDVDYFWVLGDDGGDMSSYYSDATPLLYLNGSENPDLAPSEAQAAFTATISDYWLAITCKTEWLQTQMEGLQQPGENFNGVTISMGLVVKYEGGARSIDLFLTFPYEQLGLA